MLSTPHHRYQNESVILSLFCSLFFSIIDNLSLSISLSVRPHYPLVSNIWSPTKAHSKPPTICFSISSCFSCLPSRTIFILGPRASFLSLSCHIPLYLISHIQLSFPIFLSFSCNLSLIHISLSLLSPVHTGVSLIWTCWEIVVQQFSVSTQGGTKCFQNHWKCGPC